jgi:hypothetical protein
MKDEGGAGERGSGRVGERESGRAGERESGGAGEKMLYFFEFFRFEI